MNSQLDSLCKEWEMFTENLLRSALQLALVVNIFIVVWCGFPQISR